MQAKYMFLFLINTFLGILSICLSKDGRGEPAKVLPQECGPQSHAVGNPLLKSQAAGTPSRQILPRRQSPPHGFCCFQTPTLRVFCYTQHCAGTKGSDVLVRMLVWGEKNIWGCGVYKGERRSVTGGGETDECTSEVDFRRVPPLHLREHGLHGAEGAGRVHVPLSAS